MAEIWKPKPWVVYDSWLSAIIEEASDELNDWEIKFINSIETRITNRWTMTQPLEEKLEQIYAKYTK